MKRTRRNNWTTFQAHVTLAAVKAETTAAELAAQQFWVHPIQITKLR